MFSQSCLKTSVHRGGVHGKGHAWQGLYMAGETATASNGMHRTGMHSCFLCLYFPVASQTSMNLFIGCFPNTNSEFRESDKSLMHELGHFKDSLCYLCLAGSVTSYTRGWRFK